MTDKFEAHRVKPEANEGINSLHSAFNVDDVFFVGESTPGTNSGADSNDVSVFGVTVIGESSNGESKAD